MTSREAYAWIFLEGQVEPILCGSIEEENGLYYFNYERSYLDKSKENPNTFFIYEPELPLIEGRLSLFPQLKMPNAIRDASPDAWGRRVILNKISGASSKEQDTNDFCEFDQALLHGSAIGGARPKALYEENETQYIAKFSTFDDHYSVIKAEYIAIRLAKLVGIDVAPVKLIRVAYKDVLLINRFDRVLLKNSWERKRVVSVLTLFGLDEMMARYTSYEVLCEIIRQRFQNSEETLEELFKRLVFNVLCGNNDDHVRNHAAFWDGESLKLTPAYDICPQARSGIEASQAMLITGGDRRSRIEVCINARNQFLLSNAKATEIVNHQINTTEKYWNSVCEEADLTKEESNFFWRRQFLNPYSLEGVKEQALEKVCSLRLILKHS